MMITAYPHKNSTPMERYTYWIEERENIRLKKEADKPRPWTKDPILAKYRFCNTHREDDRVTRWIAKNWRGYNDPHAWHAMIVARFINWPATLEHCGYPEPWPKKGVKFTKELKNLETNGSRIFTGAYIVSTNGATGSKVDHVIKLFERAWTQLHPSIKDYQTCQGVYDALMCVNGIGSFMAAQIVADLKYTFQLDDCADWMDFVAPGPGSQRGLNRLTGYALQSQWSNKDFAVKLMDIRREASGIYKPIKDYHLQDLQNCLCEFDKYERVLHDQGRPRSEYHQSFAAMP